MSGDAPGPRPRQVTIAGWVLATASAMLVVAVFDTMAALNSVDTRDAVTKALTTGWAKDLGMSVDDALDVMRWALYVAAVSAVVTGILGVYVLQRHATARVVLTVAAVVAVLTGPFAGGFLALVIGGAAALLWSEPARDWFAGRPPAQREPVPAPTPRDWAPPLTHDARPDAERPEPPAAPSGSPPPPLPPPTQGWGQAPGPGEPAPATWPAPPPVSPPGRRVPTEVRVACLLTWVFSGLTAGINVLVIAAFAVDRAGTIDLLRDNPGIQDLSLTDRELVGFTLAMNAFVIVWCLAASILAYLTWHRHNWARVTLLVSVSFAAVVQVGGLPYSLLNLAACAATFVLLLRRPVQEWFRDERPGSPMAPAHDWPPPGGYPPPPPPERPSGKPPVW